MHLDWFAVWFALSGSAIAAAPDYVAGPDIVRGQAGEVFTGVVFHDLNRDGQLSEGEPGVPDVLISNGLDWTRTDAQGAYRIVAIDNHDLSLIQPSGWRVPTDARWLPQFFYIHKPGGTPYAMRYGGLPDTGPIPAAIHFPLIRAEAADEPFSCAVIGDSQTYSNQQISWLRDGVMTDLINADLDADDCLLYVGDVVGDDLDLLDRLLQVGAQAGAPQWLVHGNHDFDFDARSDADSADSWRRLVGPNYYAFEQGQVLFVVLDNVVYPCDQRDLANGRAFCGEADWPRYNGRITDAQLTWLAGLIEQTADDVLIVLAHHIPFVSFVDASRAQHQTDQLDRIHAMLSGRPALSLSGHTHTIENHAPGQWFEGWREHTGAGPLPFRHIIAGAASGAWFQGDFTIDGNPMALQRTGAPPGYLRIDFDGPSYQERYVGARINPSRGQWVGLNTPAFREWFDTLVAWREQSSDDRDPVPPRSINDLSDTGIVTPAELRQGVWLTVNVWNGSAETQVQARLGDGRVLVLERTQRGQGEAPKFGADWADPFAAARQLSVSRYALQSRSGDARAQGMELFQGRRYGPSPPRPQGTLAERNMHLWRVQLPQDLGTGAHRIEVVSRDRHGQEYSDRLLIEVMD
ncbi:MAG: calcineurin-like phosphoesterase family protein, partial [Pseudomonadota bacterium]